MYNANTCKLQLKFCSNLLAFILYFKLSALRPDEANVLIGGSLSPNFCSQNFINVICKNIKFEMLTYIKFENLTLKTSSK